MMKDDNGYIVVETVGTFIPFVLLVVSILSLVNIVTLQARVHYALTQTAGTLSMYCYTLHVIGLSDELAMLDNRANEFSGKMSGVLNGISALSGNGYDRSGFSGILDELKTAIDDPEEAITGAANYGLNRLRNWISAQLVLPLFYGYLLSGRMTEDEYFSKMRIENFELTDCLIIDRNGNIKLTVEYEIEYTFGALRLPFNPTLRISQTVVTKAWIGGSGEGYRGAR